MSLFLFWGQEDYNIEVEVEKLKTELLDSSFKSMNYKVLDNPSFIDVIECVQTTPLMFGNTLSLVNMDKFLIGNKSSIDDKQLKVFEEAVSNLAPSVNVIFLCKISRDENKKVDTRKKIYKIISKHATVKEFAQYKTYQKEFPPVIQKMLKDEGLSADTQTISYLIEQLGSNLRMIASEIEKLKLAVYPNKKVTKSDIQKHCVSCDDVFALADFLIAGDKDSALKQFEQLIERRHCLEVLAVLQSNIQRFVFIKNYEKKASAKEIGAELKLHEYVVMKTIEKLKKVSINRLVQIKENLTRAEFKIKTGQLASPQIAVELALLS